MIKLPDELLQVLQAVDVTPEQYAQWVAGHEAAHCLFAILLSARLEEVSLRAMATGGSFSLARAIWQVGTARPDQVPWIIAAGPAYDRLHNPQLAPCSFRTDYDTNTEYLRTRLPNITPEQIAAFWNDAMSRADALLRRADIAAALRNIQDLIEEAITAGSLSVPQDEIHRAFGGASFPIIDEP